MNTNTGETKMSNLLLENFINEINSRRNAAITEAFNKRMEIIKNKISRIDSIVSNHNEDSETSNYKYLKAEVVENGFKTEVDNRSYFQLMSNNRPVFSVKDKFSYFNVVFVLSKRIKTWVENKQYANNGYEETTHEIYTVDTMENIEKEIMLRTKAEINNVFDMYLNRVVGMVAKIDYCSTVAKCDINTFDLKGYPTTKILIATENNTECEIRTSVKWNCSKYGKIFGQYPTTIHNITKNGNATQGNIFEITSDNFNAIWTEFKAHEKNTKLNRQIANLEKEISDLNSDEKRNPKYVAHQTKLKNKRIEKLQSQLVNVRQFRDVGQSLIREVA